jgi:hypothetical protein
MREYSQVCASTRIPGAARDLLEQYPESRHVVVVRNNRFFSLDVLDEDGRAHCVEDLERALERIIDDAKTPGARLACSRQTGDESGPKCAKSTSGTVPGRTASP